MQQRDQPPTPAPDSDRVLAEIAELGRDVSALLARIDQISASAAARYDQLDQRASKLASGHAKIEARLHSIEGRGDLFELVARAAASEVIAEFPRGLFILPPIPQAVIDACEAESGVRDVAITIGGTDINRRIAAGSDAEATWLKAYATYLRFGNDAEEQSRVVQFANRAPGRTPRS